MESRKQIVCKMVSLGMRTSKALSIAAIPRSTYYYKSTGTKKGKQPSAFTIFNGTSVPNSDVVKTINDILEEEFIDYGYIRTTEALKALGYCINKKKVYRMMDEGKLLFPKRSVKGSAKEYVSCTSPLCTHPFELFEIDIKYFYVHGQKRNAYLITIFDVFTRLALVWNLNWDMKTHRVISLLNELYSQWLIPLNIEPKETQVKIRSDNGSQFIAKLFRNRLTLDGISNEYIHPGTPQQNGHIEAFHKTLDVLVCKKYVSESLGHAREILTRFYHTYNNKRIMKSVLYKSPVEFLKLWTEGKIGSEVINRKTKYFFKEKRPGYQALPSSTFLGKTKMGKISISV